MKKTMVCAVAALVGGGVFTTTLAADAANPLCSSFGNKNPVYIAGSSASKPIWAALSGKIPGVDFIYQGPSSCVGLNDVATGATDVIASYYMDGSTNGVACDTPGTVNIGVSDVFPASCASVTVPSGFKDFTGPVQVMLMAVPYGSTEASISYDAAYTVFGWGGTQYPVAPWTNYADIFIRSPTSGTETMIGSAIGLASSKWLSQTPDGGAGQQQPNSLAVLKALQGAGAGATPSAAIGILAADYGDQFRGVAGTDDAGNVTGGLKILAFQAKNQTCGYLPDSDATHFDKINVRQGRYDIWGPLHLLVAVDGSGNPTNAGVATIIKYLSLDASLATTDAQNVIQADSKAHVIPQCAMQVSRSAEVTPDSPGMASYQPPMGCGCYYESLKNGGQGYSKYCTTCTTATDCKNSSYPKCNFGFCEAQ
jgi:ABC-type phosphate transport system substrate-binding protein